MSRLSEWVDIQRRLVAHGGTVAYLRLKGPDDSTWGTWPITTENLADTIAATLSILSEELPKGKHPCMLRAYDEAGGEVSVLPQSVEGKSGVATSIAAEQLTLQKATSAAIYNANVMNEGLRKQVEHLNDSLATLAENNVTLIDQLQRMAAENADRDIRDARRNAANEAFLALCGAIQKNAEPLLELVVSKWNARKEPELMPAAPNAPPTETTESDHAPEGRREVSEAPEPGNGAAGNGAHQPQGDPPVDRPRAEGSGCDGAARTRARAHAPKRAAKSSKSSERRR